MTSGYDQLLASPPTNEVDLFWAAVEQAHTTQHQRPIPGRYAGTFLFLAATCRNLPKDLLVQALTPLMPHAEEQEVDNASHQIQLAASYLARRVTMGLSYADLKPSAEHMAHCLAYWSERASTQASR